jgi:hypothetical protein
VVSKKKEINLSILVFMFVGDVVESCHPEGIERMQKWKKK